MKTPKLHFVDTGLACHLLGIRSPDQLRTHPLRGAVFESWVASEVRKARLHARRPADLFHLRESRGHEIDLIVEGGDRLHAVEMKSGATIATEHRTALRSFVESCANDAEQAHREVVARLVHGGRERQRRSDIDVLPWREVQDASS